MIETSLHPSEPVALPSRPPGRLARSVIGYSLLTALMMITPMVVFVPAALMQCALRHGRRAAWITLLFALSLATLYAGAVPSAQPDADRMVWSYMAGIALAIALPTMVALPLVEREEKFGRVLTLLLIASAAGLTLTEIGARLLLNWSPYALQVAQAKQTSVQFVQHYRDNHMPAEMIQLAQQWFGYSTFVLPAIMLITITSMFVLSLLMLGRLQAWRGVVARVTTPGVTTEPLRAYLFRNLSLPDWLLFAFVLGGITPLVTGVLQKISANVLAVVAFLYILQGLAIFRFLLAAMGAGLAGTLVGMGFMLFLMFTGIGPLLLGVAGLFDPFFDFRHFKKRKDDSHESHSD